MNERIGTFFLDHEAKIRPVAKILDAALTTPEDVLKSPEIAGKWGTNSSVTGDTVRDATGIPAQLAAKVVATAIVKGWSAIKKRLGIGMAEGMAEDGASDLDTAAEVLAGLVNAAAEAVGLPGLDVDVRARGDGCASTASSSSPSFAAGKVAKKITVRPKNGKPYQRTVMVNPEEQKPAKAPAKKEEPAGKGKKNTPAPTTAKKAAPAPKRTKEKPLSEKAKRAKKAHVMVDADVQAATPRSTTSRGSPRPSMARVCPTANRSTCSWAPRRSRRAASNSRPSL